MADDSDDAGEEFDESVLKGLDIVDMWIDEEEAGKGKNKSKDKSSKTKSRDEKSPRETSRRRDVESSFKTKPYGTLRDYWNKEKEELQKKKQKEDEELKKQRLAEVNVRRAKQGRALIIEPAEKETNIISERVYIRDRTLLKVSDDEKTRAGGSKQLVSNVSDAVKLDHLNEAFPAPRKKNVLLDEYRVVSKYTSSVRSTGRKTEYVSLIDSDDDAPAPPPPPRISPLRFKTASDVEDDDDDDDGFQPMAKLISSSAHSLDRAMTRSSKRSHSPSPETHYSKHYSKTRPVSPLYVSQSESRRKYRERDLHSKSPSPLVKRKRAASRERSPKDRLPKEKYYSPEKHGSKHSRRSESPEHPSGRRRRSPFWREIERTLAEEKTQKTLTLQQKRKQLSMNLPSQLPRSKTKPQPLLPQQPTLPQQPVSQPQVPQTQQPYYASGQPQYQPGVVSYPPQAVQGQGMDYGSQVPYGQPQTYNIPPPVQHMPQAASQYYSQVQPQTGRWVPQVPWSSQPSYQGNLVPVSYPDIVLKRSAAQQLPVVKANPAIMPPPPLKATPPVSKSASVAQAATVAQAGPVIESGPVIYGRAGQSQVMGPPPPVKPRQPVVQRQPEARPQPEDQPEPPRAVPAEVIESALQGTKVQTKRERKLAAFHFQHPDIQSSGVEADLLSGGVSKDLLGEMNLEEVPPQRYIVMQRCSDAIRSLIADEEVQTPGRFILQVRDCQPLYIGEHGTKEKRSPLLRDWHMRVLRFTSLPVGSSRVYATEKTVTNKAKPEQQSQSTPQATVPQNLPEMSQVVQLENKSAGGRTVSGSAQEKPVGKESEVQKETEKSTEQRNEVNKLPLVEKVGGQEKGAGEQENDVRKVKSMQPIWEQKLKRGPCSVCAERANKKVRNASVGTPRYFLVKKTSTQSVQVEETELQVNQPSRGEGKIRKVPNRKFGSIITSRMLIQQRKKLKRLLSNNLLYLVNENKIGEIEEQLLRSRLKSTVRSLLPLSIASVQVRKTSQGHKLKTKDKLRKAAIMSGVVHERKLQIKKRKLTLKKVENKEEKTGNVTSLSVKIKKNTDTDDFKQGKGISDDSEVIEISDGEKNTQNNEEVKESADTKSVPEVIDQDSTKMSNERNIENSENTGSKSPASARMEAEAKGESELSSKSPQVVLIVEKTDENLEEAVKHGTKVAVLKDSDMKKDETISSKKGSASEEQSKKTEVQKKDVDPKSVPNSEENREKSVDAESKISSESKQDEKNIEKPERNKDDKLVTKQDDLPESQVKLDDKVSAQESSSEVQSTEMEVQEMDVDPKSITNSEENKAKSENAESKISSETKRDHADSEKPDKIKNDDKQVAKGDDFLESQTKLTDKVIAQECSKEVQGTKIEIQKMDGDLKEMTNNEENKEKSVDPDSEIFSDTKQDEANIEKTDQIKDDDKQVTKYADLPEPQVKLDGKVAAQEGSREVQSTKMEVQKMDVDLKVITNNKQTEKKSMDAGLKISSETKQDEANIEKPESIEGHDKQVTKDDDLPESQAKLDDKVSAQESFSEVQSAKTEVQKMDVGPKANINNEENEEKSEAVDSKISRDTKQAQANIKKPDQIKNDNKQVTKEDDLLESKVKLDDKIPVQESSTEVQKMDVDPKANTEPEENKEKSEVAASKISSDTKEDEINIKKPDRVKDDNKKVAKEADFPESQVKLDDKIPAQESSTKVQSAKTEVQKMDVDPKANINNEENKEKSEDVDSKISSDSKQDQANIKKPDQIKDNNKQVTREDDLLESQVKVDDKIPAQESSTEVQKMDVNPKANTDNEGNKEKSEVAACKISADTKEDQINIEKHEQVKDDDKQVAKEADLPESQEKLDETIPAQESSTEVRSTKMEVLKMDVDPKANINNNENKEKAEDVDSKLSSDTEQEQANIKKPDQIKDDDKQLTKEDDLHEPQVKLEDKVTAQESCSEVLSKKPDVQKMDFDPKTSIGSEEFKKKSVGAVEKIISDTKQDQTNVDKHVDINESEKEESVAADLVDSQVKVDDQVSAQASSSEGQSTKSEVQKMDVEPTTSTGNGEIKEKSVGAEADKYFDTKKDQPDVTKCDQIKEDGVKKVTSIGVLPESQIKPGDKAPAEESSPEKLNTKIISEKMDVDAKLSNSNDECKKSVCAEATQLSLESRERHAKEKIKEHSAGGSGLRARSPTNQGRVEDFNHQSHSSRREMREPDRLGNRGKFEDSGSREEWEAKRQALWLRERERVDVDLVKEGERYYSPLPEFESLSRSPPPHWNRPDFSPQPHWHRCGRSPSPRWMKQAHSPSPQWDSQVCSPPPLYDRPGRSRVQLEEDLNYCSRSDYVVRESRSFDSPPRYESGWDFDDNFERVAGSSWGGDIDFGGLGSAWEARF